MNLRPQTRLNLNTLHRRLPIIQLHLFIPAETITMALIRMHLLPRPFGILVFLRITRFVPVASFVRVETMEGEDGPDASDE